MRNTLIALFIGLSISAACAAEPTNMAAVIHSLRERVSYIEDLAKTAMARIDRGNYRLDELERKMAGVQKQVTVLHAKKADK